MPLRSHVDLCLFIRILRAERETVTMADIEALQNATDTEASLRQWRAQFQANPMVWFHEHYHYWQGLRLPFLFWYAAFSMRAVFTGFSDFLSTGQPFEQWSGKADMLSYLSEKLRCIYEGKASFALAGIDAVIPPECEHSALLSPLDLIEGMATIAQWQAQATKPELEDPRSFSRWAKRHPSYLDGFRFTAQVLQDEALALRIFNPLVEAAFFTSQPIRGFLLLLRLFIQFKATPTGITIIHQREPSRWPEIFQYLLEQVPFETPPDSLKGVYLDHPFCYLNRENWVAGSWDGADYLHPFLTPDARAWIAKEKQNPAYGWLLAQPGWASEEVFWEAFNTFYPPVTILHFVLKNGYNRIVIGARESGVAGDSLRSGNFITLLTAFSVVRRATGTHFAPGTRLCHHTSCPHYPHNYCNLYPVIPEQWQKCGFPQRVEEISKMIRSGRRATAKLHSKARRP